MNRDRELEQQREREQRAVQQARREQRVITYQDIDGCEVTVTSGGHVFYNAADWW